MADKFTYEDEKEFWLTIRRASLMQAAAIAKRYNLRSDREKDMNNRLIVSPNNIDEVFGQKAPTKIE